MAFVTWNESYSVHVRQIDDQHKKLIEIINELFEAMKQGKGNDILGTVFNELIQYTKVHFSTEENLMKIHHYPKLAEHKKLHEKLVQEVVEMHNQFKAGNVALSIKVGNFLKDWLINHIKQTDLEYSHYFKKIGVIR